MERSIALKNKIGILRQESTNASAKELGIYLDEARTLLRAASETGLQAEARELFLELRSRKDGAAPPAQTGVNAPSPNRLNQLASRIRRERMRLYNSANLANIEQAIDGLHSVLQELRSEGDNQILEENPLKMLETNSVYNELQFRRKLLLSDALDGLEIAAEKSPNLRQKVDQILKSPEMSQANDIPELLDQFDQGHPATLPEEALTSSLFDGIPTQAAIGQPGAEQLVRANWLFHTGEYYEALEIFSEVLRLDPHNQEAQIQLAQIEYNIERGIVPDSLVPPAARVAFGRAQSLERAGHLEDARSVYQVALEEARAGGPLLKNWHPAVAALVQVENAIVACDIREQGDALMRTYQWRDAITKYATVLELCPNDIHAKERLQAINMLLEQLEASQLHLDKQSGDLIQAGQAIIGLTQTLGRLRLQMGDDQRLNKLEASLGTKTQTLIERVIRRCQQLLDDIDTANNAYDRKRMLSEVIQLLSQVRELTSGGNA